MTVKIINGDCREVLRTLPDESVHCCVTSPPYFGLRDYGVEGQIGLEPTPDEFVAQMVDVFREVRRVLRADGTLWLNLGDSYAQSEVRNKESASSSLQTSAGKWSAGVAQTGRKLNHGVKAKDLIGVPWSVAFALRADGWYLRQDIIWSKPNPMPESVTDRCTKAHEYLFLLSKAQRYFYDAEAIAEPVTAMRVPGKTNGNMKAVRGRPGGRKPEAFDEYVSGAGRSGVGEGLDTRNKRSVWEVTTQPFKEAHFATFPPELIEPCIKAGCPAGGTVLDPFGGAGTTGLVADRLQRDAILIELNPEYAAMAQRRLAGDAGMFADVK